MSGGSIEIQQVGIREELLPFILQAFLFLFLIMCAAILKKVQVSVPVVFQRLVHSWLSSFFLPILNPVCPPKQQPAPLDPEDMAPASKFEIPEIDANPFKMASVGNLQLLQTLVDPPANAEGKAAAPLNVNAKDPYGCTPLIWAARNGYVEVMDYLVAKGGDLEVTSFGGMRALHHAANQSRLPVVARLVELGTNVEVQDDAGNTPLHFAASRGILNPITLLLGAGAKVNATNKQDVTPLMKAVNAGHTTAVEKLIDNEANVNQVNSEGNSALHLAARGGFASIVKVLLEARATTSARNKQGKTPKEIACSSDITKLLD